MTLTFGNNILPEGFNVCWTLNLVGAVDKSGGGDGGWAAAHERDDNTTSSPTAAGYKTRSVLKICIALYEI